MRETTDGLSPAAKCARCVTWERMSRWSMWYLIVRSMKGMMQVILTKLGNSWDERVEKTGREWMVLLLRLYRETNERMIEAVKEFLKKMWCARCGEN